MQGLSRYNPIWDQARAGVPGRVYSDDDLLIATDFECGNGTDIRRLGADRYALRLEPEPGHHRYSGSAYYFCFGIQNRRAGPRSVRVRLEAHLEIGERFGTGVKHAVLRRGGAWHQLDPTAIRPVEREVDALELELVLPGSDDLDAVLFVSDFHWWPCSERVAYLQGLSGAEVREIGRSFQGRPMYAVEIGAADAPCMVHAQTPQPSEMGHLACRAMIEYLLSDQPSAVSMRERYRICFLPITNPDGTALGYGVSDAMGRMPCFEGHLAADGDPSATPETVAVWRYLAQQRPVLFWEWHSNNWARRPGHMLYRFRPELLADPARQRASQALDEEILSLPNTYFAFWNSPTEGYQTIMGYQATKRLGAIADTIKQHDKFPLEQSSRHAVACLMAAAAALEAEGI